MSFLGVDFGRRVVGLALSQEISKNNYSTNPLEPLIYKGQDELLEKLKQVCREYKVETVVFGLPYLKDGKEGSLSGKIREFSQEFVTFYNQEFPKNKINLKFVDESLTSFEAAGVGQQISANRQRKREVINSLAATLILETYLSSLPKNS